MVVITATYCNSCQAECDPKNFGTIQGRVQKIAPDLEVKDMMFSGEYCGKHFQLITTFIESMERKMKKDKK